MKVEVSHTPRPLANVIGNMKIGDFAWAKRNEPSPYFPDVRLVMRGTKDTFYYMDNESDMSWDSLATMHLNYHADEILPKGTEIKITL